MKLGRKRLAVAGALVIGLGLCGTGAYVGKRYFDRQGACASVKAFVEQSGAVVQISAGAPTVGILGDSYVMGDGLGRRSDGWTYRIGATRGWGVSADGISATGYTNGGFCGSHAYADRLPTLLETKPDTLIIQGGLNDWQASPADLEKAAAEVLDAAKGVPRIVMVGPVNAPSRAEKLPAVDSALKAAAESRGAEYVPALGWDLEFLPDNLHLTKSGHARFAELVSAKISAG